MLLARRCFALVCFRLCVAMSCFFALLSGCSKVTPTWVLAVCSLDSCLWGCFVSASFCIVLPYFVMNEFQFGKKNGYNVDIKHWSENCQKTIVTSSSKNHQNKLDTN